MKNRPQSDPTETPVNLLGEWERRITNIVVTGVILYIGTVANNLGTKVEVLSAALNTFGARLEEVVKASKTTGDLSLSNKIHIEEHDRRIVKLEK